MLYFYNKAYRKENIKKIIRKRKYIYNTFLLVPKKKKICIKVDLHSTNLCCSRVNCITLHSKKKGHEEVEKYAMNESNVMPAPWKPTNNGETRLYTRDSYLNRYAICTARDLAP